MGGDEWGKGRGILGHFAPIGTGSQRPPIPFPTLNLPAFRQDFPRLHQVDPIEAGKLHRFTFPPRHDNQPRQPRQPTTTPTPSTSALTLHDDDKKRQENDRIRTKTPRPNKGPESYGKDGNVITRDIDIKTSKPTPHTTSTLFLLHHHSSYLITTSTTTSLPIILHRHSCYHTPSPFLGILNLICIPKKCLYIPKLFF
jgi:hypothetical protein